MLTEIPSKWYIIWKNKEIFDTVTKFSKGWGYIEGGLLYFYNYGSNKDSDRGYASNFNDFKTYCTFPDEYIEFSIEDFNRLILREAPPIMEPLLTF